MISWSRPFTPYLSELLQIVSKNYDGLQIAPAHGDFKDTNLIIDRQERPVLVDAEWGSARKYAHSDAVEFYNRLYTLACRPDLAQAFLKVYYTALRQTQRPRFLTSLLCLSAQRAIGNFAEIEEYASGAPKARRMDYARRYTEDILSHRLLSL